MRYLDSFAAARNVSAVARIDSLRVVVVIAFGCGMLSSLRLWFGFGRTFPRAPSFGPLPAFVHLTEYPLSLMLLCTLMAAATTRRRLFLAAAVALTCALVFLDQARLQPWVFQYLVMLTVLALGEANEADEEAARHTLFAGQLVLTCLYFWSGAQKMNWSFGHDVVPGMLASAGVHLPNGLARYLPITSVCIAALEALSGPALLIPRTRRAALCFLLAMHAVILAALVASRSNTVVWPWNLGMMAMLVLLFRRRRDSSERRRYSWREPNAAAAKGVLILCGVAPALSFAGWWDMYLSGALYSGNVSIAVAGISEPVREWLPSAAKEQVQLTKSGELFLPFYEWSMAELNVPPYPELRVYRQLARALCAYAESQDEVELIVKGRPSFIDGSYRVARTYCRDLPPQ